MFRLIRLLKLPYNDWMQDPDLELADPDRVEEFCNFYEQEQLSPDEKTDLMRLIVASYDDYMSRYGHDLSLWDRIATLLVRDFELHRDTVEYWSLEDHEPGNVFEVTPLMSRILEDSLKRGR